MADRPNIVMIVGDGHALQTIGAYGSPLGATPNIDRIAADGARLNQVFCTNSICIPSRAAMLTGKYPQTTGVITFNSLSPEHTLLPNLLQAHGYYTAMVGKWCNKMDTSGLDYCALVAYSRYNDPTFVENGVEVQKQGHVTDVITDMSLAVLDGVGQGQPVFLMINHTAMHDPFGCHAKNARLWEDETIPEPANLFDDFTGRSRALQAVQQRIGLHHTEYAEETAHIDDPVQRKKAQYQKLMKAYLRCMASLDEGVGRVLDYLDERGMADNTLVVYTSDHGFFLGQHGLYDKRLMYEESIRIPCIVRMPGEIEAGAQIDRMVLNADFSPTLLDYAGIAVPAAMQGRSFRALLRGEKVPAWRSSMYYRYYRSHFDTPPHWGVRTDRHKLIYFHDSDEWELYDLTSDPHEMNNLYTQPGYESLIVELKSEIVRLREEAGDDEDAATGNEHADRVRYT